MTFLDVSFDISRYATNRPATGAFKHSEFLGSSYDGKCVRVFLEASSHISRILYYLEHIYIPRRKENAASIRRGKNVRVRDDRYTKKLTEKC